MIDIHHKLHQHKILLFLISSWPSCFPNVVTSQHNILRQNFNRFSPQAFKGKLNVRRLVVDRAVDSGRRLIEEYEAERSADEPRDSPRARIAQNLKRQIDTVSERWSMLSQRSEDWQQWIDEVLRVSDENKSKSPIFNIPFKSLKTLESKKTQK